MSPRIASSMLLNWSPNKLSYSYSYLTGSVAIAYILSVNDSSLQHSQASVISSSLKLARSIFLSPARSNKRIQASASSSSTESFMKLLKQKIQCWSGFVWDVRVSSSNIFLIARLPFLSAFTTSISSDMTRQSLCSLLNSLSWNPCSQAVL